MVGLGCMEVISIPPIGEVPIIDIPIGEDIIDLPIDPIGVVGIIDLHFVRIGVMGIIDGIKS
jgi:hypothetical protein